MGIKASGGSEYPNSCLFHWSFTSFIILLVCFNRISWYFSVYLIDFLDIFVCLIKFLYFFIFLARSFGENVVFLNIISISSFWIVVCLKRKVTCLLNRMFCLFMLLAYLITFLVCLIILHVSLIFGRFVCTQSFFL